MRLLTLSSFLFLSLLNCLPATASAQALPASQEASTDGTSNLTWKATLMTGDDSIDAFDNARKTLKSEFLQMGVTPANIKELSMSPVERKRGSMLIPSATELHFTDQITSDTSSALGTSTCLTSAANSEVSCNFASAVLAECETSTSRILQLAPRRSRSPSTFRSVSAQPPVQLIESRAWSRSEPSFPASPIPKNGPALESCVTIRRSISAGSKARRCFSSHCRAPIPKPFFAHPRISKQR